MGQTKTNKGSVTILKICINGGHYPGLDCGAVGDRLQEADVTRVLMHSVAGYLAAVGYEVLEVQENELWEITNTSNAWGADLFVSIHCNAANKRARGTETFCYYDSKTGRQLAECIQRQLVSAIPTIDRGVKEAGFYVIKHTNCPAVLVETAFIDNLEDENFLIYNTEDIAKAIARGITDYVAER